MNGGAVRVEKRHFLGHNIKRHDAMMARKKYGITEANIAHTSDSDFHSIKPFSHAPLGVTDVV
jgi:hypothetical protein